ncbi:MAG: DinB family protein [Planctomycetes bacterium]|nr:DinB family protein [Planctomycetota bacterium]
MSGPGLIAADFADLAAACERLREVSRLSAPLSTKQRPEISGWCALEHVAHVALANELIVRNLESLSTGHGALLQAGGEPVPGALEMLAAGVIPRGRAQSPRMVRPPSRIDPLLLADWLATGEQGFARFAREVASLAQARGKIPHQLLGPLDAPQWVRFARVHTRHHLAIVEALLAP